jgi:hypothetical protein
MQLKAIGDIILQFGVYKIIQVIFKKKKHSFRLLRQTHFHDYSTKIMYLNTCSVNTARGRR